MTEEQREKRREQQRSWRAQNPEKKAAAARRYAEKHPEKIREVSRRRYARDPERERERVRCWRERNRERHRAAVRCWRERNRERVRASVQRQRAVRRKARIGEIPSNHMEQLLGFQGGCCAYCHEELIEHHVDHVIPLSRGGAHSWENLVLACPACNQWKYTKLPGELVVP